MYTRPILSNITCKNQDIDYSEILRITFITCDEGLTTDYMVFGQICLYHIVKHCETVDFHMFTSGIVLMLQFDIWDKCSLALFQRVR